MFHIFDDHITRSERLVNASIQSDQTFDENTHNIPPILPIRSRPYETSTLSDCIPSPPSNLAGDTMAVFALWMYIVACT